MKRLIIATAVTSLLSACGSTQMSRYGAEASPTSPAKNLTIASAGRVENPMTIDIPAWFIKPPQASDDYIWFSGTGVSSDLSMSREKALIDAQTKLSDTLNGVVNALIKSHKSDQAGSVLQDNTSVTVKKLIAETSVTGYRIEDSKIVAENRGYRTFVLLRYPLGDANRLLKDRQQRENQNSQSEDTAQGELNQEIKNKKSQSQPLSQNNPTFRPGDQVALINTDNQVYAEKREEALRKPNAVVLQETIR
jgi:hypothetical protein